MGKPQTSYTVVIFPGSTTSEPYRFSLRKGVFKFLLGFSALFMLVFVGLFVWHFQMRGQLAELKDLRRDNKTQKIQIQNFSSQIDGLTDQVVRLVEFDRKLRVMTDIGPPKGTIKSYGVGGAEELHPSFAASDLGDAVKQDLSFLQSQVSKQEQSFQELETVVQSRQSLWASTPSIWPTSGWLSSDFGKRISPFTGHRAMHRGIDIAARSGTPIIAPAAGVVTYYRFNGGFGRYLKVNHGYGTVTHYGHLSKSEVKVGQKVKRGDIIGYVGNTGLSTGPHLHYEVYVNNVAIDPMKFILN